MLHFSFEREADAHYKNEVRRRLLRDIRRYYRNRVLWKLNGELRTRFDEPLLNRNRIRHGKAVGGSQRSAIDCLDHGFLRDTDSSQVDRGA